MKNKYHILKIYTYFEYCPPLTFYKYAFGWKHADCRVEHWMVAIYWI